MIRSPSKFVAWLCLAFGLSALAADIPCTTCHAGYTAGEVHAALDANCAACHGDGEEHAKQPVDGAILGFKDEDAKTRSAPCMACHRDVHAADTSAHDRAGVTCNDCHAIHGGKDDASAALTPAGLDIDAFIIYALPDNHHARLSYRNVDYAAFDGDMRAEYIEEVNE